MCGEQLHDLVGDVIETKGVDAMGVGEQLHDLVGDVIETTAAVNRVIEELDGTNAELVS